MRPKLALVFLIVLLVVPVAKAQEYYADVEIEVTESGLVTVSGITNHPSLIVKDTSDLTSKKGRHWLLNLTVDGKFTDFVYTVNFPRNTEINYIKTPYLSRIYDTGNGIAITGTGKGRQFSVVAQYSIYPFRLGEGVILIITSAIGLIIVSLSAFFLLRPRRGKPKSDYAKYSLTERQKKILDIISKSNKPVTQAYIEKLTRLPKSSLSRNVDSLARKGIIQKQQRGMSNLLILNGKNDCK